MGKSVDITKAVRQHAEMEDFFTGGFTVKTHKAEQVQPQAGQTTEYSTVRTKQPQVDESTADIIAAELEKIADETRQCRKCGLGSLRLNAVPGEGRPNAQIVFVGEGPGADEDAQGRPFVGRAGQLLDKIIAAMGLARRDVFICNVLKCRPPDNRDPKPEEVISCLPYLQRQLELINPKIIVALGAHAAKALLNTNKPIGQLRGLFHEYYAGFGRPPIKLMATFHPAYLLRNYTYESRQKVWEDMKTVLEELGLPVPQRDGK